MYLIPTRIKDLSSLFFFYSLFAKIGQADNFFFYKSDDGHHPWPKFIFLKLEI